MCVCVCVCMGIYINRCMCIGGIHPSMPAQPIYIYYVYMYLYMYISIDLSTYLPIYLPPFVFPSRPRAFWVWAFHLDR